jgi:hypothetical protein
MEEAFSERRYNALSLGEIFLMLLVYYQLMLC